MSDDETLQGGAEAEATEEDTSAEIRVKKKPKRRSKVKAPARPGKSDPRGRKPKYNWDLIYREFVEGVQTGSDEDEREFFNYRELSDRHSIPYGTIRDKAAQERWQEKKEQFALQATVERQRTRSKRMAARALSFDEKAYKIGEAGLNLVMMRIAEIMQDATKGKKSRQDALERLEAGLPVDPKELRSQIYYRELNELASAAERWQSIGMKALGTDVNRVDITGGPESINIGNTVQISKEVTRDDPERVAAILTSLSDVGFIPPELLAGVMAIPLDEDVVDAEVVEAAAEATEAPKQIEGSQEVTDANPA